MAVNEKAAKRTDKKWSSHQLRQRPEFFRRLCHRARQGAKLAR
jgi:hypothetical protein